MLKRTSVVACLIAATGILVGITGRKARAQTPEPSVYPVMSAARAQQFIEAASRGLDYLPGEVIVKFKADATVTGRQRALRALRSRPTVTDLEWIDGETALHHDELEYDAHILSTQLMEQPEVAYAEPNYIRHFQTTPSDPGYAQHQWNFSAIDMPRAWDINPGGTSSVIVAVVDTGVTTVTQTLGAFTWNGQAIQLVGVPVGISPEFSASRFISPADFINASGASTIVVDVEGHGTHVTSTIGENINNNLGEAGIAYNVKLMPVKVCAGYWDVQFAFSAAGNRGYIPTTAGGCPVAATASGIRYAADNGAKVINLSLGGASPSSIEQDALNYAVSKGAFIAISAGNCFQPTPSECPPGVVNPPEFPASFAASIDGAVAVAAVGPSLSHAYHSSAGSYVEISAPGGSDLEGGANGMIWQATIFPPDSDPVTVSFPRFDRYAEVPYEGTSMAAPHVSGVAALIVSQGVTNPALLEALIKKTARPLGTASGRSDQYGFGLIQPRAALFGFGIK